MRFSPHCKSLPIKGDSGQNDSVDHHISRPHQYLQYHPDKFTPGKKEEGILKLKREIILTLTGGGSDGDGGVGDCLYCLCLCGPYGVSYHILSLSLSLSLSVPSP